ncbi:MAG TPA: NADH-quinone oxidoreductase subunit L [Euzebyales bacterium]|nr:NADH-quinone oxidoreductase subunit L [Euzebyales bacterium]
MAQYAWLIPLLPAVSALLILSFGKRLAKGGALLGITALALAFVVAVGVSVEVFSANVDAAVAAEEAHHGEDGHGAEEEHAAAPVRVASAAGTLIAAAEEEPVALPEGVASFLHERGVDITGMAVGAFEAGQRVDGLAAMMFLLVTFVSLMVHIYSLGYMDGDPRFTWFYTLLSVFTMSMLILVISNNLMLMLVGWELVGICSFLLIGFWWEEKINSSAAIKAFLTTKFGDVGLVVGVVTLWGLFRTFDIGEIIAMVQAGTQAGGAALDQGLLTFGLVAMFAGAIGKSAQFPLHTWLPDAMAGPTPVSALIHAATMVTAGVFLVARLYPVFQASATAQAVIAIIGAITLFSAGLLALVQDDVKRVLAYSTVSQLGYMVAALAFSYTAGIFHLFTHGFFKALLFLGAGSLIHAVHSNNMSDMGGLRRFMPYTFVTFMVGSLALMAIPPLAGFWSKDEVLVGAFEAGGYTGSLVATLGALGGFITALYMTRTLWLVFGGEYRGHGHPHESPGTMKWPLVVLAVPAALIGFINLPFPGLHERGFAAWTMFDVEYFVGHPVEFNPMIAGIATLLALGAVALGTLWYRREWNAERDPLLNMGAFTRLLERKYYLDDLYTDAIVRTAIRDKLAPAAYWTNEHILDRIVYGTGVAVNRLAGVVYDVGDQRGIDAGVNGIGLSTLWSSAKVRLAQSGNVQLYAGAMFTGVAVLAIVFAVA